MKKVIIRTREDELTSDMYYFGTRCAKSFIEDLEKETYGADWKGCVYSNDEFSGWTKINKSGTISVCVFSKHNQ